MKKHLLPAILLLAAGTAAHADKSYAAYGTVFTHRNGQRTETQKMGNSDTVRQDTYNKNDILTEIRTFQVDNEGRLRSGVIYDGRKNAIGSTRYFYDPNTNQMLMEELFNKNGKLVRRLYYPGALKDPKYAKRTVAFSFDPEKQESKTLPPADAGVEIRTTVKPIVPVTSNDEDFEPGASQASAAPTMHEAAEAKSKGGSATVTAAPKVPPRRPLLQQRK